MKIPKVKENPTTLQFLNNTNKAVRVIITERNGGYILLTELNKVTYAAVQTVSEEITSNRSSKIRKNIQKKEPWKIRIRQKISQLTEIRAGNISTRILTKRKSLYRK